MNRRSFLAAAGGLWVGAVALVRSAPKPKPQAKTGPDTNWAPAMIPGLTAWYRADTYDPITGVWPSSEVAGISAHDCVAEAIAFDRVLSPEERRSVRCMMRRHLG